MPSAGPWRSSRIVKTKMQGWVIDEADLKEFFEFSVFLLLSPVIPLHEFAFLVVFRVVYSWLHSGLQA
jgi:hypothetical protein